MSTLHPAHRADQLRLLMESLRDWSYALSSWADDYAQEHGGVVRKRLSDFPRDPVVRVTKEGALPVGDVPEQRGVLLDFLVDRLTAVFGEVYQRRLNGVDDFHLGMLESPEVREYLGVTVHRSDKVVVHGSVPGVSGVGQVPVSGSSQAQGRFSSNSGGEDATHDHTPADRGTVESSDPGLAGDPSAVGGQGRCVEAGDRQVHDGRGEDDQRGDGGEDRPGSWPSVVPLEVVSRSGNSALDGKYPDRMTLGQESQP